MSEEAASMAKWGRRAAVALGALVLAAVVGYGVWSWRCPCDRTAGGILLGERGEPVTDWSFANEVPLCQIQVRAAAVPYSINLNCMATPSGALYLSCSVCDRKRWAGGVVEDGRIRLRLDGTVWAATATRVTDPAELDRAWRARVDKLQRVADELNPAPPPDAERPDHWWSFRVESRGQ